MHHERQVPRLLDDEHRELLALLERAERTWARDGSASDPALARAMLHQLEVELERHFGFEEQDLFPRMADAGDGDLASLLAEEHDSIREVAAELRPLLQAAVAQPPAGAEAARFARLVVELVERQVAHVQKESMALLPLLEDLLDDDGDRELAMRYAAQ
ncbi:MAG: hemerythrin domain-containing protein [Rubrivivax sp.]|nr:hemerythrin domain-containing protein [Rubrivivax sp.]